MQANNATLRGLFSFAVGTTRDASNLNPVGRLFPPLLGYIRDISDWNKALYVLIATSAVLLVTLIHCSSKGNIIEK